MAMKITSREFLNVKTPTCHASTVAIWKDSPIFAWFGGEREGLPDSSIYIQYKGKIKTIGTKIQVAYWNPILFTIEDELFLAYKRGIFCDRWQTYILNITDIEEKQLKEKNAQLIPAGLNFCVKTKPIVTKYNEIYCGSSVETQEDWTSYIEEFHYHHGEIVYGGRSRPLVAPKKKFTFDHPWQGMVTKVTSGIIQPSLWIDKHGHWHAFFRSSKGLGKIYHTAYVDHEWLDPEPTNLNNPNSGVDTVYMNGKLFLIYNPSETARAPIVISELNYESDHNFEVVDEMVVQEETEGDTHTNELSYPYMIENNGKLNLVYTYGRSKIEYVTVEV